MPKPTLDLVIKNVRVVRGTATGIVVADLGVRDGQIARLEPGIPPSAARQVYDGRGQLAFPGVVDAHTHVGIYGPLADDAVSESRAAVSGGVTTMLTYFRTGQYYLNRGGEDSRGAPATGRPRQREPALRDGRHPQCLYAGGAEGHLADRPRRVQR